MEGFTVEVQEIFERIEACNNNQALWVLWACNIVNLQQKKWTIHMSGSKRI